MRKTLLKNLFLKLTLPFLFIISSALQASPLSFSNVYIFGDSLSDTGNLAYLIGDFPPPYYNNRASNGPVAVETLAQQLGHSAQAVLVNPAGSNYAIAGARANPNETGTHLSVQVDTFHALHGFIAPSDALYVIFIGGNDIRTALSISNPTEAAASIQSAANEVSLAIDSLSQAGARTFLLVNAPDLRSTPEIRLIAEATANPDLTDTAHELSKQYRNALHDVAEQLEDTKGLAIAEFDLFRFFNKLLRHAEMLGFTNSTDACVNTTIKALHADCQTAQDMDQFIFFDELHPTARVHAMVGEAMLNTLKYKF